MKIGIKRILKKRVILIWRAREKKTKFKIYFHTNRLQNIAYYIISKIKKRKQS